MKRRMLMTLAGTATLGLALSACGGGGGDPLKAPSEAASGGGGAGSLVVGSANFPENQLLAEIYAQALTAKGVQVTKKLNIGSRETYLPALKNGEINLIPEYTGNFDKYLNPKTTATDAASIMADLKKSLPEGLTVLEPSKAEDKDSVTVTRATAEKYKLKTIADLEPVAKDLVLGGPPEWKVRDTGVPGLKKVYNLTFKSFKELDAAGTLCVQALKSGTVDAVNLYTTDPSIAANDFVPLEDPKGFFVPQQVVPVISKGKASDTVTKTLDEVSAKLDTPTLAGLVKDVVADKEDASEVAGKWLKSAGLA